ncbi:hypothetical protein EJD97_019870 [Solanum chilense]|uniref:Uncharacterized protein n=1 Tax=Solanum chilense TaxID=4083 RepID=A0A6N2C538_SOLCI|nr:hypothetical protein EJD97_019870 [Solanum chilense]
MQQENESNPRARWRVRHLALLSALKGSFCNLTRTGVFPDLQLVLDCVDGRHIK